MSKYTPDGIGLDGLLLVVEERDRFGWVVAGLNIPNRDRFGWSCCRLWDVRGFVFYTETNNGLDYDLTWILCMYLRYLGGCNISTVVLLGYACLNSDTASSEDR